MCVRERQRERERGERGRERERGGSEGEREERERVERLQRRFTVLKCALPSGSAAMMNLLAFLCSCTKDHHY